MTAYNSNSSFADTADETEAQLLAVIENVMLYDLYTSDDDIRTSYVGLQEDDGLFRVHMMAILVKMSMEALMEMPTQPQETQTQQGQGNLTLESIIGHYHLYLPCSILTYHCSRHVHAQEAKKFVILQRWTQC